MSYATASSNSLKSFWLKCRDKIQVKVKTKVKKYMLKKVKDEDV